MGSIRGEIGGEITGTVGDVTITTWKGLRVARRRRGPSTKPPTQALKEQRERFAVASDYGREVGADPALKAVYLSRARGLPTTWRALAIKDFLMPPRVVDVRVDDYQGNPGKPIDIRLQDVTVKEVEVRLLTPDGGHDAPRERDGSQGVSGESGRGPESPGTLVEQGQARRKFPDADSVWVYTTQKRLPGKKFKLVITAEDVPGNRVTHAVEGEVRGAPG